MSDSRDVIGECWRRLKNSTTCSTSWTAAWRGRGSTGGAHPPAGRRLAGPVDGYFLHGTFWFSSGRNSVRMRHLAARPAVSATHLPGEELAVTVHGRADLFEVK